MTLRRFVLLLVFSLVLIMPLKPGYFWNARAAQKTIPTPEQFLGFKVGEDRKLARWDKIVEYMRTVAEGSDRVHFRELGKSTNNNPFIALEISSADTIKNLDHYKQLERKLYFQDGAPTAVERDEIIKSGKAVVVVTCDIHATEIGSSQMVLELVYNLATDNSPATKKILDNVIFVLVPSLNPDGQIMVTDWYNKNLGTEFENSPLPYVYHPYVGHDNNRDMYMFTQKESQLTAQLLWHDWFPSVWLDEHQQGSNGARIFVMPATDPINPNVHPLIYRWNGILGQSQAAALEAAGKEGIIYNSTYTNFWEGAMAWSGWWHNEVGLLTEVASARIASPIDQRRAVPGQAAPAADDGQGRRGGGGGGGANDVLPPPTDINPRTEYPRPWMGGHWTLRDIVDYELIATMALLETAADQREQINRQIYEVNRITIEEGAKGNPSAIIVPIDKHDQTGAGRLVDRLRVGGVDVYRATTDFDADGKHYAAGTFVIPMNQVFARYAKDMIEKQVYPEVRRAPNSPPEPPYDVTAWSLGMQMGVDTAFVKSPLPANLKLDRVTDASLRSGSVTGNGKAFSMEYAGAETAIAINRLLKEGATISTSTSHRDGRLITTVNISNLPKEKVDAIAKDLNLTIQASDSTGSTQPNRQSAKMQTTETSLLEIGPKMPRIAMYQSWTANMDEGWTRWLLENYEFPYTTLHNADVKAGKLHDKFDAIIMPDQQERDILSGQGGRGIRPEYRGGIGDEGIEALRAFVQDGGTLIAMGASSDLFIDKFPIPVKDLKRGLTRDQHFAPGTIVRLQIDDRSPLGAGMPTETFGFYNNSPFFALTEGFNSYRASVVARYPNTDILASGWLKGEDLMVGHAAVVLVETNPGRIILFGIRPQHRDQTRATFPLLFNSLYLSAKDSHIEIK